MKIRRIAATAGAIALTATAFAAPANAQNLDFADAIIDGIPCESLNHGLTAAGAYEDDHAEDTTTRNELAQNIRGLSEDAFGEIVGGLPYIGLIQVQYSGKIADKAQDCGFVVEDPELPFGSSQLFDNLPMLEALSSEFA